MPSPAATSVPGRSSLSLAWVSGILAALLCALLTLAAYQRALRDAEAGWRDEIVRQAQNRTTNLRSALAQYETMLDSLRSLFESSREVTRAEFRLATERLLAGRPALQAVEWVPLVTDAERAGFEQAVQAEGFPGFIIRDRALPAREFPRAETHADYLPVLYTEPFEVNRSAFGFNLQSGEVGGVVRAARETGQVMMTPRAILFNRTGDVFGFVVYFPVYDPAQLRPGTGGARFRGHIVGVFRFDHFFGDVPRPDARSINVDLLFLDTTRQREPVAFQPANQPTVTRNLPAEHEFRDDYSIEIPFPFWGRQWSLLFRPTPGWLEFQRRGNHAPLNILFFGLLASLGFGAYVYGRVRRRTLIEQQVAQRTAELRHTQQLLEEDIRHRQAAETKLRESETRLQAVIDHSPGMIFVKDPAGRYVLFNRAFEALCGRPAAEIAGRTDQELFPAVHAEAFRANDRQTIESGHPMEFEETVMAPHGPVVCIVQKFPLRDSSGRIHALCGIATDITARKQSEAELQESRRQLSNLVSQLPGTAFRCAADDNLTTYFASDGILRLTGYTPEEFVTGRVHLARLTEPADRPRIRNELAQALQERQAFEIEYRIRHRDGSERWILVRGRPIYAADGTLRFLEGLAIDVTALKRTEQEKFAIERQLLEARKLESLGVLAGGIAHDFNNLLTAVLGNASLLRQALGPNHEAQHQLQHIENAARRAADLCTQMLAYAGKGKFVTAEVDTSALVHDTTALLQVSVPKGTHLQLDLAGNLPPVLADATQLRQIVMNLVLNAVDAIDGRADGRIRISTQVAELPADYFQNAVQKPALPTGRYVVLEVSDNGSGMTPETQMRIFEPFFTTKFSGRGLGLAAVLGIIRSHRGALLVDSQPGTGTAFRVVLPVHQPKPSAPAAAPAPDAAAPADTPLHGTILLVDDERTVRQVASAVLTRHGARVIEAADGDEALAQCRQHSGTIDLILLDLTMPGLSGEETLRRLRLLNHRQKVVVMSGYSETETMRRCASLGAAGFLAKPFEIDVLIARVRQHLP